MAVPTLPTPGGSEDVWGDELNAAITEVSNRADAALAGLDGKASVGDVVTLEGGQTIVGEKAFLAPVTSLSEPSEDDHLATKKYVDDNAGGGGLPPEEVDATVSGLVDDEESATRASLDALYGGGVTPPELDQLVSGLVGEEDPASETRAALDALYGDSGGGWDPTTANPVVIGQGATGATATAVVGRGASASANGTAMGDAAKAASGGVALGRNSSANNTGAVAVGSHSSARGYAVVIGTSAAAQADDGIAIGWSAKANALNSIAIGTGAVADTEDQALIRTNDLAIKPFRAGAPSTLTLENGTAGSVQIGIDDEGYLYPTRPAGSNITVVETIDDVPPGLPTGSVVLVLDAGEAADPPTIIGHSVVESAGSGVTFTPPTAMEPGDIILAFLTSSADSGTPWTLDTDHSWEWISEPAINANNRLTRVAKGVAAFSGETQQTSLFSRTEAQRGAAVFVVLRGGSVADVAAGAVVGQNAAGAGTTTVGGAFASSANALHLVFSYGNGNVTSGHSADAPVASGTLDSVGGGAAPTPPSAGFTAVHLWARVLPASGSSGAASVVWPNVAQRGGVSVVVPPRLGG